jgi:hypothetical protein
MSLLKACLANDLAAIEAALLEIIKSTPTNITSIRQDPMVEHSSQISRHLETLLKAKNGAEALANLLKSGLLPEVRPELTKPLAIYTKTAIGASDLKLLIDALTFGLVPKHLSLNPGKCTDEGRAEIVADGIERAFTLETFNTTLGGDLGEEGLNTIIASALKAYGPTDELYFSIEETEVPATTEERLKNALQTGPWSFARIFVKEMSPIGFKGIREGTQLPRREIETETNDDPRKPLYSEEVIGERSFNLSLFRHLRMLKACIRSHNLLQIAKNSSSEKKPSEEQIEHAKTLLRTHIKALRENNYDRDKASSSIALVFLQTLDVELPEGMLWRKSAEDNFTTAFTQNAELATSSVSYMYETLIGMPQYERKGFPTLDANGEPGDTRKQLSKLVTKANYMLNATTVEEIKKRSDIYRRQEAEREYFRQQFAEEGRQSVKAESAQFWSKDQEKAPGEQLEVQPPTHQ